MDKLSCLEMSWYCWISSRSASRLSPWSERAFSKMTRVFSAIFFRGYVEPTLLGNCAFPALSCCFATIVSTESYSPQSSPGALSSTFRLILQDEAGSLGFYTLTTSSGALRVDKTGSLEIPELLTDHLSSLCTWRNEDQYLALGFQSGRMTIYELQSFRRIHESMDFRYL